MDEIHNQSFGNNFDKENQDNINLEIPLKINQKLINNDNASQIKPSDSNLISIQNKNYQNQILVLTQRIKEYEKDYINKNTREENQIKEFILIETDLKNKIKEKDEIISSLNTENNFLKEQLNHMENNVEQLKGEVKKLILIRKEEKDNEKTINLKNIPKEEMNLNINQSNDILELTRKYSLEISKLKKQNEILTYTLQCHNVNENNLNNNNNINNSKYSIDSILGNYANQINKEMYIISRWIDTYLVCEFNKCFDVPPLINEENDIEINDNSELNLVDFTILKKSLDNAIQNLNNLINNKETEIIEITNMLNEKELKYNDLKKELFETKKNLYETKNEKEELFAKLEDNKKEFKNNIDLINDIKESSNKNKENQNIFLSDVYSVINKEIINILEDTNFKSYHEKFLSEKNNKEFEKEIINIEEMLLSSLNKLIEFIEELKFDYIQIKKENINIIKDKAINNLNILKNENVENINENEIEEYKKKIERLLNENKLLKEQIEINNKKNQIKEMNDNEKVIKYKDLEKQINDLKENNNDLQNKIKNRNEGNFELEKKNNILENEVEKLKSFKIMFEELKEKYDSLSFDYTRIQKENNSLKTLINNQ